MKINKKRTEALRKLADYLMKLPPDYKDFCMADYARFERQPYEMKSCGSVACAVGHGPAAGIRPQWDDDWESYCERRFLQPWSREWEWCFSARWEVYDNTPHGAAKRIYYLLDKGAPPEGWSYSNPYGIISDSEVMN